MAIEPIKGFYVHDEATDTDGVAKYDAGSLDGLDETVSRVGYAPDAKAVGDRLTDLKSDITNAENILTNCQVELFYKATVLVDYQVGRYIENGYNISQIAWVNNIGTLPAGTYYFGEAPTGFLYGIYRYVSDTEGIVENSLRSGALTKTISGAFKITLYKQAGTAMTADDIRNIESNFQVTRLDPSLPQIDFSTDKGVTAHISELYAPNGVNLRFRQFYMTNGVGRIAIQDDADWVCFRDFSADAPAQVGKVYEIPPYNNSGITAWIVLKDNTFSYTGTGNNYYLSNAIRNIRNTPIIANGFMSDLQILKDLSGVTTQKIVFLGDSIFGMERGSTSIPSLVGKYTSATTYNCALGGTEGNSHGDNAWKYFDFTELSKAIVSGDYTNQIAHENDSGVPSYFASVFDTLESLDFSEIDLICATYGGNDYNMSDSDVDTFVTAMCTNINRILEEYPNIRFMLMTPPYKRFLDDTTHEFVNDGDTKQNEFGNTLKDYAESYKTISETVHAPYINAYDDLGINRYNATQWFITNDGSHPSEQGRKETAKLVAEYLKRMLYN